MGPPRGARCPIYSALQSPGGLAGPSKRACVVYGVLCVVPDVPSTRPSEAQEGLWALPQGPDVPCSRPPKAQEGWPGRDSLGHRDPAGPG